MIKIPSFEDLNSTRKANEFLADLFYIRVDAIKDGEYLPELLQPLFPAHLLYVETEKCRSIFFELFLWIQDDFVHDNLRPIHQYCLYNLLEEAIEVRNDLGDEESSDGDSEVKIGDPEFYLYDLFEDNDFLHYEDYYNTYNTITFHMMQFDPGLIELLPSDKREEIERHRNNVSEITSEEAFLHTIHSLISYTKRKIEENRGYVLLWDDEKKRKEESAQILLTMLFDGFFEMKKIGYSREVDTGRGCVDFKISNGEYKYLIEVKNKMGLVKEIIDDQLGLYMKAEKVSYGMLIVFIYTDEEYFSYKKIARGYKKIDKMIHLECIDARPGKRTGSK